MKNFIKIVSLAGLFCGTVLSPAKVEAQWGRVSFEEAKELRQAAQRKIRNMAQNGNEWVGELRGNPGRKNPTLGGHLKEQHESDEENHPIIVQVAPGDYRAKTQFMHNKAIDGINAALTAVNLDLTSERPQTRYWVSKKTNNGKTTYSVQITLPQPINDYRIYQAKPDANKRDKQAEEAYKVEEGDYLEWISGSLDCIAFYMRRNGQDYDLCSIIPLESETDVQKEYSTHVVKNQEGGLCLVNLLKDEFPSLK